MGPRAIPDLPLPERVEFTPFTLEEMQAIPLTAHGKIMKYIAGVNGNWDIAQAAVKGYRDYIGSLFDTEAQAKRGK